jgi:hypothetical protein
VLTGKAAIDQLNRQVNQAHQAGKKAKASP